jgi:uncharacterized membrane protein
MTDVPLSLAMLTAFALIAGALYLFRLGERQRPALMLLLAVILFANVVIWTLPTTGGATLAGAVQP